MNTAEQLAPEEPPALSWDEICARYPDQYVCLVDMVAVEPTSPVIKTARVVGHGLTDRAAFDPIRDHPAKYRLHAVRFTGVCTKPLIRPAWIIDDEFLKFFYS
jgi:hypothetical protein